MIRMALLIGVLSSASTAAAQASPPACMRLAVVAYPSTTRTPPQTRKVPLFSATQVADLEFRIVWGPGSKGAELFQLRLFTPAGHLYQAMDLPVGLPGKQAEATRNLNGYPFPVPVARREAATAEGLDAEQVSARLPLGGSLVSTASLYGRWRAEAWPDNAPAPCASVVFDVTP